jgi:hypothetical protein
MARNTLPFPPGLPFHTTKNGILTPLYPPGLHIDPDVVLRQAASSFIPDFPPMANINQHDIPLYGREIALKLNNPNRARLSLVQSYESNIGTVIKLPSSSELSSGETTVPESQKVNSGIPSLRASTILQRQASIRCSSQHLISQPYGLNLLHDLFEEPTNKFESSKNFASQPTHDYVSINSQEMNQQAATCLQAPSDDAPSQRSRQLAHHTSKKERLENDQRSDMGDSSDLKIEQQNDQMLTKTYGTDLEAEMIQEDIPPPFDNWGLPNASLQYYIERVPYNPHMLDHEYTEEDPKCILEISPAEALTFGTWTEWDFNSRIQCWMINQDFDGMTNTMEEVFTVSNNSIASPATVENTMLCEDTVEVWESISSTEETIEKSQTLHDGLKQIAIQVKEYLKEQEDWLPGETSPGTARVMQEVW